MQASATYRFTVMTVGPEGYGFDSIEAGSPASALVAAFDAVTMTQSDYVSGVTERFEANDGSALHIALAPGSRIRVTREIDDSVVYDEAIDYTCEDGAPWQGALNAAWLAAKDAAR